MEVQLRPATATDIEPIARLHRRSAVAGYSSLFEAPAPPVEDFVDRWATAFESSSKLAITVADVGGSVVGVVACEFEQGDPSAGRVERLYVEPDHWGSGIGGLLHEAAVEAMVAAGCSTATLFVVDGNVRASDWYARLGWRPTRERRPVLAAPPPEEIRLRRDL